MSQNPHMFWLTYHIITECIRGVLWFEWHNLFHTCRARLICFLLTEAASWSALLCCSCLSACHTFSFLFLSFFFLFPLYLLTTSLVCVSACLSLGSDSAQKAGLQPCHVSLWLQGQYQTCPWRWQCKYCWSWRQTLVRVGAYHCHANLDPFWLSLLKIVISWESQFYPKRPDLSQKDKRERV